MLELNRFGFGMKVMTYVIIVSVLYLTMHLNTHTNVFDYGLIAIGQ